MSPKQPKVDKKKPKQPVEEELDDFAEGAEEDFEGLEEGGLEEGFEEGLEEGLEEGMEEEGLEEAGAEEAGAEEMQGLDGQEEEDGDAGFIGGAHRAEEGGPDDMDGIRVDETLAETDTQLLRMKINSHLKVLTNFKELREEGKARSEYIMELKEFFCNLYGYNTELMEIFFNLFSPHECSAFLEAMEEERPTTIRTNTLKTRRKDLAQALAARRVELEPVGDWSKVGLKINESKVAIGATPEYLGGHYMLQSACSFLPVLALAPKPGEKVLDMAAAPGGKTTYIAQMMKNQGVLVANDSKKERLKSLYFNVQRLGISNCIVVNYDGRKIPIAMRGFDKVLLDAPCTGLGVISRDPSIKSNRTLMDVKKAAHLQRELLRAAVDCCKVGGTIVYSTCSIAAEENEGVIDYIIKKRFVKVVETGLPIEKEGITSYEDTRFDPRVKMTRRVYPHMHNMDGFFIAKMIKVKDGKREQVGENEEPIVEEVAETKPSKSLGKRDRLRLKANLPTIQPRQAAVLREPEAAEAGGEEEPLAQDELAKRKLDLKKRLLEKRKKLA